MIERVGANVEWCGLVPCFERALKGGEDDVKEKKGEQACENATL